MADRWNEKGGRSAEFSVQDVGLELPLFLLVPLLSRINKCVPFF